MSFSFTTSSGLHHIHIPPRSTQIILFTRVATIPVAMVLYTTQESASLECVINGKRASTSFAFFSLNSEFLIPD